MGLTTKLMDPHNDSPANEEEIQLFLSELDEDNFWVQLADDIRWDFLIEKFKSRYSLSKFYQGVPERTLLAAFVVKYRMKLSSNATLRLINENQFLQYFCQTGKYFGNPPLTAELMRNVRDLIGRKEWPHFKKLILMESASSLFQKVIHFVSGGFNFFLRPPTKASKAHIYQGLETQVHLSHSGRRTQRRKKSKKNKLKKWVDLILWATLIFLFFYSLWMIISEPDWKGKKKKTENKWVESNFIV